MEFDTIFFIGPQGSGKGTQAKLLAKKLGFYYWENGSILRTIAEEASEIGQRIKSLLETGILVPDDLMFEVLKNRLAEIPQNQGVVFDGIPRRITQAEFLLPHLKEQGRLGFVTVFLNLSKDECINRLLRRSAIENRPDDTLETIELRLQQYYTATMPVVEYLRGNTELVEVDGQPPTDQVTENINKALGIS